MQDGFEWWRWAAATWHVEERRHQAAHRRSWFYHAQVHRWDILKQKRRKVRRTFIQKTQITRSVGDGDRTRERLHLGVFVLVYRDLELLGYLPTGHIAITTQNTYHRSVLEKIREFSHVQIIRDDRGRLFLQQKLPPCMSWLYQDGMLVDARGNIVQRFREPDPRACLEEWLVTYLAAYWPAVPQDIQDAYARYFRPVVYHGREAEPAARQAEEEVVEFTRRAILRRRAIFSRRTGHVLTDDLQS